MNSSSEIQLTISQLAHIFEQVGYPDAQIAPFAKVSIQLEPFQLQAFKSPIIIPMPSLNTQNLTVESIISSSKPIIPQKPSKLIHDLANKLGITDHQFINAIKGPSAGNLEQLTDNLNHIFDGLIDTPLTQEDVRLMLI